MLKAIILALPALFTSLCLTAQNNVHIEEVSDHIGELVMVCDKIYEVNFPKDAKAEAAFLKLGGAFPKHNITVLINADDRKNFSVDPESFYLKKDVCVTGRVIKYKGKTTLVIRKPTEIQIGTE